MLVLVLLFSIAIATNEEYTVSIITSPTQGPFRLDQRVNFSCIVKPVPLFFVTYQWRTVDHIYSQSTYITQNFSRNYDYDNLRYSWYFCEVSVNQTIIGSANRLVEVQGFIYATGPVVKSFSRGNRLQLIVNTSSDYYARFINSLSWYHNGTRINSSSKYTISNDEMALMINSMIESDAGVYEAKIGNTSRPYRWYHNHPGCDAIVLPLLETVAAHAPVTFTVQENIPPRYEPLSKIATFHITQNDHAIELKSTSRSDVVMFFSLRSLRSYWYRNGARVTGGGMFNLTIDQLEGKHSLVHSFNYTEEPLATYTAILIFLRYYLYNGHSCEGYEEYLAYDLRLDNYIPLSVSSWTIAYWIVHLIIQQPVIERVESTIVWCTANGETNLTLWRHKELLAQVQGHQLSYTTTPYMYGSYQCAIEGSNVRSKAFLLQERAHFQLLYGDENLCGESWDQRSDVLKVALSNVFTTLCLSCANVSPNSIENLKLDCTKFMYLTADLVYSNSAGRITASTLLNMFSTWMLSQEKPTMMVNGRNLSLVKKCPVEMNSETENVCIGSVPGPTLLITGVFFGGFVAGICTILITWGMVNCIRHCTQNLRHLNEEDSPQVTDKTTDIAMGTNQAYETINVRYASTERGREQNNVIYDTPAH